MNWPKNVKRRRYQSRWVENIKGAKPQKRKGAWNCYQNVGEKIKMHRMGRHQSKSKKNGGKKGRKDSKVTITTSEKNEMRHGKRRQ